jgi:hypothetical protein
MYIPSDLAYGSRGSPPKIGPDEVLIFTMEIIKINGETKPAISCNVATLEDCDDKEKGFVTKAKSKLGANAKFVDEELSRLGGMKAKAMKPELADWVAQRVGLLKRMKEAKDEL